MSFRFSSGSGWVTALLTAGLGINLLILAARFDDLQFPDSNQGFEPIQPIAFSHRLHSGEMQISCLYCHPAAARSRWAGTPPANLCLNCHRFVSATLGAVREEERLAAEEGREPRKIVSDEISRIYTALGLDSNLEPVSDPNPIRWVRVHRLPDFVVFHHGVHDVAGVDCAVCHGDVTRMERVRQYETLSMGWCVNCHRDYEGRPSGERVLHPRNDCGVCHY